MSINTQFVVERRQEEGKWIYVPGSEGWYVMNGSTPRYHLEAKSSSGFPHDVAQAAYGEMFGWEDVRHMNLDDILDALNDPEDDFRQHIAGWGFVEELLPKLQEARRGGHEVRIIFGSR